MSDAILFALEPSVWTIEPMFLISLLGNDVIYGMTSWQIWNLYSFIHLYPSIYYIYILHLFWVIDAHKQKIGHATIIRRI